MSHETVLAAAIEHSGGAAMFSMVIVAVALIAAGVVTFLGLKVSKDKENAAILDGSDHGDITHRSEWASAAAPAAPLTASPLADNAAWADAAPLAAGGLLRPQPTAAVPPQTAPQPPQPAAPRYATPAAPPAAAPRRPGLPVAPPSATQQPDWLNGNG